MHDGKGGTGHVAAKAKTACKSLHDLRLARTEDSMQGEDFPSLQAGRPAFTDGLRGINVV